MFDFKAVLTAGLHCLDTEIPAEATDRLALYFDELTKWSAKINLIAKPANAEQVVENHFLDSLTLLPLLRGTSDHLLDVGSGAGFPGLVCKTVLPELTVTLVEPRAKRVSFLKHIIRTLALTGIEVLCSRVEDESRLPSGAHYSHITGRAVTELGSFLKMTERFAYPGMRVICMKGPKWREELDKAASVLHNSCFPSPQRVEAVLPFSKAKRTILVFTVKNTQSTGKKVKE
ncbi:MAG: 16S rRNA (guanine(527)-N(7))-methyltransferase RsmG [Desulforhopalus sp.]